MGRTDADRPHLGGIVRWAGASRRVTAGTNSAGNVALSADKVRGHKNYDVVYTFAEAFSVAPRTFWVRRDDLDFEVFCFAKPEDADAFCEQFGGKRLPSDARR